MSSIRKDRSKYSKRITTRDGAIDGDKLSPMRAHRQMTNLSTSGKG